MATYDTYAGPAAGFAEQVYCYDPWRTAERQDIGMSISAPPTAGWWCASRARVALPDGVGRTPAALEDGTSPGLEPGTNFPNFPRFERKQGRLMTAPPAGKYPCQWSLEVHDTAAAVAHVQAEIRTLQAHAPALITARRSALRRRCDWWRAEP